jgi:hypothetical protein
MQVRNTPGVSARSINSTPGGTGNPASAITMMSPCPKGGDQPRQGDIEQAEFFSWCGKALYVMQRRNRGLSSGAGDRQRCRDLAKPDSVGLSSSPLASAAAKPPTKVSPAAVASTASPWAPQSAANPLRTDEQRTLGTQGHNHLARARLISWRASNALPSQGINHTPLRPRPHFHWGSGNQSRRTSPAGQRPLTGAGLRITVLFSSRPRPVHNLLWHRALRAGRQSPRPPAKRRQMPGYRRRGPVAAIGCRPPPQWCSDCWSSTTISATPLALPGTCTRPDSQSLVASRPRRAIVAP